MTNLPEPDARTPRLDVYEDRHSEWRWRLVAANGEVVAQGESHTTEADARRAARTAQSNFAAAPPPEA